LNPSLRVLLFTGSALALPGLSFLVLVVLASLLLVLALVRLDRRLPLLRLVSRSRWLFLLVLFSLAYSLPGPALLPLLGEASPSTTGVVAGAHQALRLLVLLLLLDRLVLSMSARDLLGALHPLFSRLAWTGLDPERVTVRLSLTMQKMEARDKMGWHTVRESLEVALAGDEFSPGRLRVPRFPWRRTDTVLLALMVCGVVLAWK